MVVSEFEASKIGNLYILSNKSAAKQPYIYKILKCFYLQSTEKLPESLAHKSIYLFLECARNKATQYYNINIIF